MYQELKEKLKLYTYYIIIGVVSLLALIVLPLINSTIGLETNFPDTKIGWIVWITCKLIVATLNILIFHSFVQQAKINSLEDPNYKEAIILLGKIKKGKEEKPRSPRAFLGATYGKKGTTIFTTTLLALVAFSQAIFSYNWQDLITYGFTVIMGIIFGIMTMMKVENYWQHEFLEFAKMKMEEQKDDNIT